MEQNFIKKLGEKWADFKYAVGRSKLAKKAAGLMLAGAMTVPMLLSASACEVIFHKNPNGDIVVDPNPSKPNPNLGGDVTTPQPDYSNYSGILQTVLTSEYYNDLAKKAANSELDHFVNGMRPFDTGKNLIEALPYRFLQNEGIDIESVQLDESKIATMKFLIYKDALPTYTNNVFALERPLYVYTREVEEVQNITCFGALVGVIGSHNLIEKN